MCEVIGGKHNIVKLCYRYHDTAQDVEISQQKHVWDEDDERYREVTHLDKVKLEHLGEWIVDRFGPHVLIERGGEGHEDCAYSRDDMCIYVLGGPLPHTLIEFNNWSNRDCYEDHEIRDIVNEYLTNKKAV